MPAGVTPHPRLHKAEASISNEGHTCQCLHVAPVCQFPKSLRYGCVSSSGDVVLSVAMFCLQVIFRRNAASDA